MQLQLRLLGTFEVERPGEPPAIIQRSGPRALLAYLALEAGRAHEREHLAALLWPDAPPERALTNLRQALHRLRATLGEGEQILSVSRHSVRLDRAAISLDTVEFMGHLRATAGHQHRLLWACPACMARLRAAVELYSGPLLPGFQAGPSLPFEEWLLERRDRLHQGFVVALDALAVHHTSRGETAAAAAHLRRWLAAEPWREEAHVRLITLLWQTGARAAALRQYERCRAALAAELGSEPAPRTQALAEAIRRDEDPGATLLAQARG